MFLTHDLCLDVNECDPDPCQNGATCFQGEASFLCVCAPGWQGALCEEGTVCFIVYHGELCVQSRLHVIKI